MRNRLIDLICAGTLKTEICTTDTHTECETCRGDCGYCTILADHLIANGVIVPPCWFGDTLYRIVTMKTGVKRKIVKHEHGKFPEVAYIKTQKSFVRQIVVTKNNFFDVCDGFGKTIFPTREEAKQALLSRSDKND